VSVANRERLAPEAVDPGPRAARTIHLRNERPDGSSFRLAGMVDRPPPSAVVYRMDAGCGPGCWPKAPSNDATRGISHQEEAMSESVIRAAVVQLRSGDDVHHNLETVRQLVELAAQSGARLIALPENFCFLGSLKEKGKLAESLTNPSAPILKSMRHLSRQLGIHLILGGMPTKTPEGRGFYNTAVALDPSGDAIGVYHKIHLFDINIPDGAVFQESAHVTAGETVTLAQMGETKVGLSVCYDLRFPELYRRLVRAGAEILCIPAAFTLHTGKDHWLPLLRARAIENECYVLAPAQFGRHNPQRASFGKSCIVDPWGAIIAQVPDKEGYAMADLDLSFLQRVRQGLPCLDHIRLTTI